MAKSVTSQPSDERGATPSAEAERILETLRRAVASVCPRELVHEQEDIVQSAMVRVLALQRGGGEQVGPRPASYLWRAAFTAAVDELRRRRRREALAEHRARADEASPAHASDPAGRSELGAAIRTCLQALAPPRRLAVGLHLQGFRADEASRALGFSVKRVQNLAYRGLDDLRRCLASKGFQP